MTLSSRFPALLDSLYAPFTALGIVAGPVLGYYTMIHGETREMFWNIMSTTTMNESPIVLLGSGVVVKLAIGSVVCGVAGFFLGRMIPGGKPKKVDTGGISTDDIAI